MRAPRNVLSFKERSLCKFLWESSLRGIPGTVCIPRLLADRSSDATLAVKIYFTTRTSSARLSDVRVGDIYIHTRK